MNKLLVAVFHDEAAVDAGLTALHGLHAAGDITLYATGVIRRSVNGGVRATRPLGASPVGTTAGLAVGGLIGLLGGPVGVIAGALHDYQVAGVGMDFIDEAARHLAPGMAALVAEVEEEWVIPVDNALEAVGGQLFRRSRTEAPEARFDHDIETLKCEIDELTYEAAYAGGTSKHRLQAKLLAAERRLDTAVQRAQDRVDALQQEAEVKVESLKLQLRQAKGDVRVRIEDRLKRVKGAYRARGTKLSQAWSLTKEAFAS